MIRMSLISTIAMCAVVLFAAPADAARQAAPTPTAAAKPALNLNAATLDQLELLPGIGRKTAERILEYRTKNGGFKRIEDLMNIRGIGEKAFLKLKPLIIVKPLEKGSGH